MNVSNLPDQHPVPTLATIAFVIALVVTALYFSGFVPGIPKTLPTFVNLLKVTIGLFVAAVVAWMVSLASR